MHHRVPPSILSTFPFYFAQLVNKVNIDDLVPSDWVNIKRYLIYRKLNIFGISVRHIIGGSSIFILETFWSFLWPFFLRKLPSYIIRNWKLEVFKIQELHSSKYPQQQNNNQQQQHESSPCPRKLQKCSQNLTPIFLLLHLKQNWNAGMGWVISQ